MLFSKNAPKYEFSSFHATPSLGVSCSVVVRPPLPVPRYPPPSSSSTTARLTSATSSVSRHRHPQPRRRPSGCCHCPPPPPAPTSAASSSLSSSSSSSSSSSVRHCRHRHHHPPPPPALRLPRCRPSAVVIVVLRHSLPRVCRTIVRLPPPPQPASRHLPPLPSSSSSSATAVGTRGHRCGRTRGGALQVGRELHRTTMMTTVVADGR
uniref:Uncharacterized protein n=1 Tax=Oryza sativa subsp. japonica TaxID=39947 RepID=Q6Z5N0_ORYSJ|nr:hypothetical protein [Oryza sativa Japonica Group]BAD16052.1 hypothetical protein [Oryza sativa Japonica Group]